MVTRRRECHDIWIVIDSSRAFPFKPDGMMSSMQVEEGRGGTENTMYNNNCMLYVSSVHHEQRHRVAKHPHHVRTATKPTTTHLPTLGFVYGTQT